MNDDKNFGSNVDRYRLQVAEAEIIELKQKLAALDKREEEREKKRLLWGISALGTAVMFLVSLVWSQRGVFFK